MLALEILTLSCGISGAYLTSSANPAMRLRGFLIFTVGALSSIALYQAVGLYVMTLQSTIFLLINVRGIKNNLNRE